MIRLRTGTVLAVTAERPGAVELSVEVEGGAAAALAYPGLVGPVGPGDRVVLNTTAVALHLGTGGLHFVVAVEGTPSRDADGPGHTMKARYTPQQVKVLAAEEAQSPHRDALARADSLGGVPVVWTPLHSMLAPVVAGARAAGAHRVAYVMTDGAALPAAFSRLVSNMIATGVHRVEDADNDPARQAEDIARGWIGTFGATLVGTKVDGVRRCFEGKALVRVRATVAHDSYERLVEVPCAPDSRTRRSFVRLLEQLKSRGQSREKPPMAASVG